MKPSTILRSAGAAAAAAALAATIGLGAGAASAAAQTGSAAGMPFDLGPSPVGLPGNCLFANGDANWVFSSGTVVMHETTNKNGDWGGMTAEGTAQFYEGTTPLYQGHLTVWFGGGNNAKGQSEGGFTVNFNGTGADGSLSLHANGHMTTNAAGTQTANPQNVSISCG